MNLQHKIAWWPIPRLLFCAIFIGMGLGAFIVLFNDLSMEYFLWSHTNLLVHDSLWIPGAILAGVSSAIAVMINPVNSIFRTYITTYQYAPAFYYPLLGIIVSAFFGYLLGCVPLFYLTARYAIGAGIYLPTLMIVFSGIVLLVSIGFFAGLVVKKYFIAPVVTLGCFAIMGVIAEPFFRPLALIFPVHQVEGSARFVTNPAVAWFSLIFALLFMVAGVLFFSGRPFNSSQFKIAKIRREQLFRFIPMLGVLMLLVCAFGWRPELLTVRHPVTISCFTVQKIEVCVHEENVPATQSIVRALKKLQKSGLSELVYKISDDAATDYDTPQNGEVMVMIEPGPYDAYDAVSNVEESVAWQVVTAVTTNKCRHNVRTIKAYDANAWLASNFFKHSGYVNLAQYAGGVLDNAKFATDIVQNADLRSFVVKNQQNILDCALDELP